MSHPENWTRIELEGGKYTVCHVNGTNFHALRHGAQWRDLTGDGLVLAMAQEIEDLRIHAVLLQEKCDNAGRNASAFEDRMGNFQVENGRLRDQVQLEREKRRSTWTQLEQVTGLLREVVSDLPTRRDWLDPVLEARMKATLSQQTEPERCEYCDGTGDVHRADGEWLGECKECDAAEPAPAQDEREAFDLAYQCVVDNGWESTRELARYIWDHANARPAQAEQQPVAWLQPGNSEWVLGKRIEDRENGYTIPVYIAPIAQTEQQPVGYQFQDREGVWKQFMNERHYEDTLADGTWPIRPIYTAPIAQTEPRIDPDKDRLANAIAERTGLKAKATLSQQVGPVDPANCTNEDSWNCKYCRKTETCDALKDERNFGTPPAAVIPTGWKLVPVTPTEAMLDEIALTEHFSRKALATRYTALLDAAPTQEIPQ